MFRKVLIILISFIYLSCAASTGTPDYQTTSTNTPNFGITYFHYALFPEKQFIVLKEHNDYDIAIRILASYTRETLINALSIAYVELPSDEQLYVSNAFSNAKTLPYRFNEAIAVAITRADEIADDPTLNSLKNLIVVTYANMNQAEIQSRYFYGLNSLEQNTFKNRWNHYVQWYEQKQKELQEHQQRQQAKSSGGSFWGTLGKVIVGVVAGYAAYRAATYNSRVEHNITQLQMQNFQIRSQLNHIQSNLHRLAY